MTQCKSGNIKLCNSRLDKLQPATKSETAVRLGLSPNVIYDSSDETNFPQVSKAFRLLLIIYQLI